jgi:hypothetical protein
VSAKGSIQVGCFDDVAWIRVDGPANHLNSAEVKSFASQRIAADKPNFVIDLENCTTLDSTFIGTLTSIVLEVRRVPSAEQGQMQIINANERNRLAMTKLGLQCLLEIDEDGSTWARERELVSQNVTKPLPPADQTKKEHTEMVMQAHEALIQANSENFSRFQDVLEYLKRDLDSESSSA